MSVIIVFHNPLVPLQLSEDLAVDRSGATCKEMLKNIIDESLVHEETANKFQQVGFSGAMTSCWALRTGLPSSCVADLIRSHDVRCFKTRYPSRCVTAVCLVPHAMAVHHHTCWHWAKMAWHGMVQRRKVLNDMAIAQTMGGGWACIRNVRESSKWAVKLYHHAEQIGDEATMRKCRVFVGYAYLWQGNKSTSNSIFADEMREALAVGDHVQFNRCVAAQSLLDFGAGEGKSVEDMEDLKEHIDECWGTVFGGGGGGGPSTLEKA